MSLANKSKGHYGLDYHYTLIMKLLDYYPGVLPEKVLDGLYKTLVM